MTYEELERHERQPRRITLKSGPVLEGFVTTHRDENGRPVGRIGYNDKPGVLFDPADVATIEELPDP